MNIDLNLNKLEDIDEALDVSIKVFKPTHDEVKKYHNKEDWLNIIENDGLLITATSNGKIIGFTICYSKEESFHIWNVGVLENYRRFGVWKKMYQAIIEHAKSNGFKYLTINTYRNKFPEMYNFCLKNGFREYKTEKEKSFFIKNILNQ